MKVPHGIIHSMKSDSIVFECDGYHCDFGSDGRWALLKTKDSTGKYKFTVRGIENQNELRLADMNDIAFSPNGQWICAAKGGYFKIFSLHDISLSKPPREFGPWPGDSGEFSSNNKRIVIRSKNKAGKYQMYCYSVENGQKLFGPLRADVIVTSSDDNWLKNEKLKFFKLLLKLDTKSEFSFHTKLLKIVTENDIFLIDLENEKAAKYPKFGRFFSDNNEYMAVNKESVTRLYRRLNEDKIFEVVGACIALTDQHMIVNDGKQVLAYEIPMAKLSAENEVVKDNKENESCSK
jgi:hypothetical protein